MNLERAAQALVECKHADQYRKWNGVWNIYWIDPDIDNIAEVVDPINNEAQRQALLEWFKVTVMPDKDEWEASAPDENWDGAELYNSHHEAWGKTRLEAENACLSEILK